MQASQQLFVQLDDISEILINGRPQTLRRSWQGGENGDVDL